MAAAGQDTQEALGLASPPGAMETMTGLSRRSAPPPAPVTLSQAEGGSATATAGEGEEERRQAETKERIEGGVAAVVYSFSTLLGCLCFLNDAKHENNMPFSICFFLAFATFVSGNALILLGINMLGLRGDLVSDGQYVAARCLAVSCTVLTLFSLVALLRSRLYQYIGLAAVTVVLLPAAGVYWYLRRRTGRSDETHNDENEEELEAASKITSCITNSAFGGLVGSLFSASKISGAEADAVDRAVYVAIFIMLATAVLGVLVMMVSKKVPGITEPRIQRRFITVIRLANALLLFSLACAALAAAFVVLRYRVFAAFAPLVITGIICVLLRHSVVRRGRVPGEANNQRENQQEQLKAIEDLASKVTFGGIMGVLGGSIGEKYNSQQAGVVKDTFMVVLTSAFVSGLGIMLLAAAPGSARTLLAPAAKVLIWSSVALFAATVVAVYGVEVYSHRLR